MTDLATLLVQARAAVDAMAPDELAHMRHQQRISFAYGNVARSRPEQTPEELAQLRAGVTAAAGPCPCGPCNAPPLTEGEVSATVERIRAAVAQDAANPSPPKPPSQIRTYDPTKVRVTYNGVELIPCGPFLRYSPSRDRRQTMRAARRARKLRRGWA